LIDFRIVGNERICPRITKSELKMVNGNMVTTESPVASGGRSEATPVKAQSVERVTATSPTIDGIIDIRFLLVEIANKWWLILVCVAIGGYFGIRDMHAFGRAHIAKMVVMPIESNADQIPRGNGIVGVLSGLGVRSSKKTSKFDRMVFIASTLTFAKMMEDKYHLMDRFYGDGFDKETGTWIVPGGMRSKIQEKMNSYLNLPVWAPPSIENLARYIGGGFKVEEIKNSPFKIVSFRHGDGDVALELLKMIYSESEELVKQNTREEQRKQRLFLEETYRDTEVLEFKQALAGMMVEHAKIEMMSHNDLPSIARIIDPPYVSKFKTAPNTLRLLGVPMFGGLAFGIGLILLFTLIRRE
jgi:hypothetical protein